jgi:ribonuclease D
MGKLVMKLTGGDVGQGLKFSQWDHRPLSAMQTQYAANDVRYLPLVRRELARRLEERGNTAWAEAECLTLSERSLYEFDPRAVRLRLRGAETLRPRQKNVLRALLAWREDAARHADAPPRSLVSDGVLLALARRPAKTTADLAHVRHLPRPVEDAWGPAIVELTLVALREPPIKDDDAPPPADRGRVEALWAVIEARAADRAVSPAILAGKREVARLLARRDAGLPDDTRLLRGWRGELLGDILATV